ncbi:hypothetical protein FRB90_005646 [Tulasnella sp. 427]|nr:hypothetical protein FRB90_005646 [Tulasnella sp. 427]
MINSDKQLSPNQVIDISGFQQGSRLPSNAMIQQVFSNCGQIQSIHNAVVQNDPHVFVVFDTIGAARAALQLKHESWVIQSMMRAPEDIANEFNKCIARSGWQSRGGGPDFGGPRPEDRVGDVSVDDRFAGDHGWSSRRRPGEPHGDYERPVSNHGSLPPQAYRGLPDPSFADSARDRNMAPRDSVDGARGLSGRSPPEFRRPSSPPGRQGLPDAARYDGSVPSGARRGPPSDYPPSFGPGDRSLPPRDARGPYSHERLRRDLSPPPQWTESRRRPFEDTEMEVEVSNKRPRLSDGGESGRPRPRDYPPVEAGAPYRGAIAEPPFRQPPPRGPPDVYPPPPPPQYRSRTMDDQYPASSGRYPRDDHPRYRSNDEFDGQYRRPANGAPYPPSSLEPGSGYRGPGAPPYPGYSSPDAMSRSKPLPPVGRPGPSADYPATYRVDDRRGFPDYRQPEEPPRRFVESGPPSRMSREDDPRRGYMDGYGPPPVDDRRYDGRRYDSGMMDREYDRRGSSQYPGSTFPPSGRPPSPPRQSLASRLGMEPRGSAMDASGGPRYRGSGEFEPMMTGPSGPPGYRDDYRRMDDPRDRDRFDDRRAPPRPVYDLKDRVGYDPRERERAERDRDRERDRDYPDDRYRRDGPPGQGRPYAGTRVSVLHPADGTVIFVSNLPAQVSQPRFRRIFSEAVGADNVMDINTGRAGFAFIRIRTRELAEEAVAKLHHVEFAPKYKMNVSIGKPPSEYKKWKNNNYHNSKRALDKSGASGSGDGQKSKKKKKNKKARAGNADKEKPEGQIEPEGVDGEDCGDESGPASDADGADIRFGDPSQMTQEEIEAFMENMAKETGVDHSNGADSEPSDSQPRREYNMHRDQHHYDRDVSMGRSDLKPVRGSSRNDIVDNDIEDAMVAAQLAT